MLLFVDQLTNSDFSYLHPTRGLLGETWLSHIQLEGALDEQGMVCDFGLVKRTVRELLDDQIDHRLLVPGRAENLEMDQRGESVYLRWLLQDPQQTTYVEHESPPQCITVIDAKTIDRDTVANWCIQQLRQRLPTRIDQINLSFSIETIDGAYYHYSHGLKKHDGKCQRIAHGHRSKIEIWSEGRRETELEMQWSHTLRDCYVATQEDQVPCERKHHWRFEYRAREGDFSLVVPQTSCVLLASDSTVENIAQFIAGELQRQHPGKGFTVKAFEGLGKGAIVKTTDVETTAAETTDVKTTDAATTIVQTTVA